MAESLEMAAPMLEMDVETPMRPAVSAPLEKQDCVVPSSRVLSVTSKYEAGFTIVGVNLLTETDPVAPDAQVP